MAAPWRSSQIKTNLLLVLVTLAVPVVSAHAGTLAFTVENDFFGSAGTDRYYTNGVKATLIPDEPPDWSNSIGNFLRKTEGRQVGKRKTAFSVGQNIYTPRDIERTDLITDDRPYGGWLYAGIGIHDRENMGVDGETTGTDHDRDRLVTTELVFGMVGPQSYAREVQTWWHKDIIGLNNTREPRGWDNQLKNEFGIALGREVKWRKSIFRSDSPRGFGIDRIFHLGGVVGNIYTYANTGAEIRCGWALPNDFGTAQSRPFGDASGLSASEWEYPPSFFSPHFFIRVDGRAVARNIFLDGNTFADSHSVDKKTLVGDLSCGINITLCRELNLTYTHVYHSKEFEQQPLAHVYGSVTLAFTHKF